MNKLHGILFGVILLSGTITPSFAQPEKNNFVFTLFDMFKQKIPAHSDVKSFGSAAIILTSSTTTGQVEKITLCHVPPGNPSKAHTISVSSNAVLAHLAHGDYLGACDVQEQNSSQDTKSDNKSNKENKNKNSGKGKH